MQSHPIRVLLIDDDEDDYIVVRDLLSGLFSIEFILKWAADYRAGLDAILSGEFDVCLLDYRIEERNGLELMQEVLSRGTMTPIIFFTGKEDYDLDLEAMSKGAADYLIKTELSATLLERSIRHAMERQRKEEAAIKAKRVIQALSECNHAVIHSRDEAELLHAICRIVVDVGGYRMAWVGYAENDRDRTVTPVAKYGYEKDYLKTVKAIWQDGERGSGPTGACIRTGCPSIIRCVGNQAEFAPWEAEASKRGYASVIGLPLLLDEGTLGALTIYSSETDAFDTTEVEFLVKLSSNLSYGLGVLRLRKAQMQAEESLKEAYLELERRVEERTAELIKANADLRREIEERRQAEDALRISERRLRRAEVVARFGNWELMPRRDKVKASEGASIIYGLEGGEWTIPEIQKIPLPEYRGMLDKALNGLIEEGKPYNVEYKIRRATDGKIIDIHSMAEYSPEKGVVFGVIQDITARKKAEEALRQSEREKAILNKIANVFLTIPDEKIYEEVLAVILDALKCRYGIFGYIEGSGDLVIPSMTKEIWSDCQVEGKSIVFPRHLWGDSLWGKAIKEKKSFCSDGPFQTPEGHLPVYNFLTVPIVFADKTIGLASAANKDGGFSVEDMAILERIAGNISPILNMRLQRDKQELERKQAEDALRKSEELYRTLVRLSPDPIAVLDLNGSLIFTSPKAKEMYGGSPDDEFLGRSIFCWIAPEEHEKASANLRRLLKEGTLTGDEYTLIKNDGTRFIGEVSAAVIYSPDGSPMRIITITRDVTERKRAQDELFNSRQVLRSILDNIPQRVFWKDRDSIFVGCNKPFALDCGYKDPSELVGKTSYETASAATADLYRADDRVVMERGRPKMNYEEPQIRPDGSRAWLITSKVPMYDQDGHVAGMLGTYSDITERKLAEDSLRQSEERFSRFFRATPVGTSITRLSDGQYADVNDAWLDLIGYTREEVIGQNPLELGIWADPEDRAKMVEILLKQGRVEDFETRFRRRSGEILDVLVSAEVIDLAGHRYILGLTHDVTERKRMEEELRENQSRLELAVLSAHMGVWHWDLIKDKRFFDDQVCRLLGIDQAKFTGTGDEFFNAVHPDDREALKAALARTIGQDAPYETEYRAVWPDGSVHYIIARAKLFRDETGQPVRVNGLAWDITDRKLMEEAVAEAEAKYRDIFENLVTGIYQVTLDGGFLKVNEAIARIHGYDSPEELLNEISDARQLYVHPERRSELVRLIEEHGSVRDFEVEFFRKDKSVVWVALNVRAVRNSTGQIAYMEGTALDITGSKLLKAQLEQVQKMEAIGTLAGGIAHDFNNILAPIIGYTELSLNLVPEDASLSHNLRQILLSAHRAKDLVGQILTFSRKTRQERKPVQVSLLIKEVVKLLRSSLPSTIEIGQTLHQDAFDSTTMADPTHIHQVLMNLCTNAAHAMRSEGGTLAITLENVEVGSSAAAGSPDMAPGPYLKLSVADTGHGMEEAVKKRIFDPFFTTKGPNEGTGLGLAVVYGIVKDLSGAIAVSSKPGEGTTFEVYVPRIKTIPASETAPSEVLPTGHGRVLVVDDEKSIVDMVKEMLDALGYEAVSKYSSTDALEAFRSRPESFDLLITDMMMPRMTGIDLAKEILKIRPRTSIILCTGFSDTVDENKIKPLGIKELLMKPVSMRDLAVAVNKILVRDRVLSRTTA
jgi:PAS domain S-box-containing protein